MSLYRKIAFRISQLLNALYGPFNSSLSPPPPISLRSSFGGACAPPNEEGGRCNQVDRPPLESAREEGDSRLSWDRELEEITAKVSYGKKTLLKYYYLTSEARQKQEQHEGDRPRPGRPVRQPDRSQGEGTNSFVGILIAQRLVFISRNCGWCVRILFELLWLF